MNRKTTREVLNSLLHFDNVDPHVTGSNSRFLSTDIATEFRGRSYEIHLAPLSVLAVSCWLLAVSRQKPIANSQKPIAKSQ
ncbi:MAG: AAA family ATPase [Bacteroidales bacterium]|nr:AAA family ATPase [Bacteroidales bacterium]